MIIEYNADDSGPFVKVDGAEFRRSRPGVEAALLAELGRLEWVEFTVGSLVVASVCLACTARKADGHKPGCTLDAALKAANGVAR